MAQVTIKIVRHEHKIDGDRYYAYLHQPHNKAQIIIACEVDQSGYLNMCECLNGLRVRLEMLGNTVITENEFVPDPNFKTDEEVTEYWEKQ